MSNWREIIPMWYFNLGCKIIFFHASKNKKVSDLCDIVWNAKIVN